MNDLLAQLDKILHERKNASPESSYVAQLHAKGLNKILEKVGEEATETILAAKDAQANPELKTALIAETADLWFHSLVMLAHLDLNSTDVLQVLAQRMGISGLEEKASRTKDSN